MGEASPNYSSSILPPGSHTRELLSERSLPGEDALCIFSILAWGRHNVQEHLEIQLHQTTDPLGGEIPNGLSSHLGSKCQDLPQNNSTRGFAYVYSTTVAKNAEKWEQEGLRLKRITKLNVIPVRNFAPVMEPLLPTLFSIDVEGMDFDVLKSNNWVTTRPRVICIEEWEESLDQKSSEIRKFLEDHNYSLVGRTSLSSIFVEKSFLENQKMSI